MTIQKKQIDLKGVIVPTPTPFTKNERVHEGYLRKILSFLVESGVHGIFLLGSTAEGVSLRDEERKRSIQIAIDKIAGRIPLLVGAMDFSTARIIDRVKQAEDEGAKVIIVSMPFACYYSNKHPVDQQKHFEEIFNAGNPVTRFCVYKLPAQTQNNITIETFNYLMYQNNCIAFKDSSGDFTYFQELLYAKKGARGFSLFTGSPWDGAAAIIAGADGMVSTPANIDPVGAVKIYEAALTGDTKAAFRYQQRLTEIRNTYGKFGMLAGLKYVLKLEGLSTEIVSSPLKPLSFIQKRQLCKEMKSRFPFLKLQ